MLVARTDPDVPKHRGLTYFICDMHAPGVDVRPLRQMTGQAEFNEVYLTDVRIPDAHRIGDVGDGWRISLTTLMNERVAIGGGSFARKSPDRLGDRALPASAAADAVQRDAAHADVGAGPRCCGSPCSGPATSRAWARRAPRARSPKLLAAEYNKAGFSLAMSLAGPEATLYPSGYEIDRTRDGYGYQTVQEWFLRCPGQLDRGRHLRGHAQHPRRAGARPPRRRPGRQGAPLEGGPPLLSTAPPPSGALASPDHDHPRGRRRVSRDARRADRRRAGWGDGLPLVAPTEARVDAMLAAYGGDPDEVVGVVAPRDGEATPRTIAANAVMAGCPADVLPVLVAAVRALADAR